MKNRQGPYESTNKTVIKPEIPPVTLFAQTCYTGPMQDELEFRRAAESALGVLMQHLIAREAEDEAGFEVEEQNGVLNVEFGEPPAKFVVTPNAPMRQIWISALSTSFKLDWEPAANAFILPRTGEQLTPLVDRLIKEHLAS
jgi:CyaY protein